MRRNKSFQTTILVGDSDVEDCVTIPVTVMQDNNLGPGSIMIEELAPKLEALALQQESLEANTLTPIVTSSDQPLSSPASLSPPSVSPSPSPPMTRKRAADMVADIPESPKSVNRGHSADELPRILPLEPVPSPRRRTYSEVVQELPAQTDESSPSLSSTTPKEEELPDTGKPEPVYQEPIVEIKEKEATTETKEKEKEKEGDAPLSPPTAVVPIPPVLSAQEVGSMSIEISLCGSSLNVDPNLPESKEVISLQHHATTAANRISR